MDGASSSAGRRAEAERENDWLPFTWNDLFCAQARRGQPPRSELLPINRPLEGLAIHLPEPIEVRPRQKKKRCAD